MLIISRPCNQYMFIVNDKPYEKTTCIPRWNNVKTTISTSFQRELHVMYSHEPRNHLKTLNASFAI